MTPTQRLANLARTAADLLTPPEALAFRAALAREALAGANDEERLAYAALFLRQLIARRVTK